MVPVRNLAIQAVSEAERGVVGGKVTRRLSREPGSHKVLKYVHQVVKRRDTGELRTPRRHQMC